MDFFNLLYKINKTLVRNMIIPMKKHTYPIGIKKKNGSISIPLGAILEPEIPDIIKQNIPKINGKM